MHSNKNSKAGIYQILNTINLKRYVGQSKNISSRWYTHKKELRSNKHPNGHLQAAWNKYGEESFIFSIVECCEREILTEKEDYWINRYNSLNPEFGYNLVNSKANKHNKQVRYPSNILKGKTELAIIKTITAQGELTDQVIRASLICKAVLHYIKEGMRVICKKNKRTFTIEIFNEVGFYKSVLIDKQTLEVLTPQELKNRYSLKVCRIVYEVKGKEIIRQIDTSNATQLSELGYSCEKLHESCVANSAKEKYFSSLNSKIFICQEDYNPSFEYYTRWESNKINKVKKQPAVINYSEVLELSKEGVILNRFNRVLEVLQTYPHLHKKRLGQVLNKEKKSTQGLYFTYAKHFINQSS